MKIQLHKLALSVLMATAMCGFQVAHADDADAADTSDTADTAATTTAAPNFVCVLTDTITGNSQAGAAKTSFTPATPMIYLICDSDNIKKGAKAKGVLTAIDTNNAAPANYKVGEAELAADGDASADNTWHANFNMSKPTKGWPVGSYKYEVFVDGKLAKTVNFTVK